MNGFVQEDAIKHLISRIRPAAFGISPADLPPILEAFILYDLHFMRLTGVLDPDDNGGESDYDDDEAFEYIFDAYLSDHPMDEDASMQIASLLNQYMDVFYDYLQAHGLVNQNL